MQGLHPFPARMASELAMKNMESLRRNSTVLDPMAGSGTVLRHACELGHRAVGYDLDPLAVLMTSVACTPIESADIDKAVHVLTRLVKQHARRTIELPWMDCDPETVTYVSYWFGNKQLGDLRLIAYCLYLVSQKHVYKPLEPAFNVLRLALSRIIVTKDCGASLARDISHSRPHKVKEDSDYDVPVRFAQSVDRLRQYLSRAALGRGAVMRRGDARHMKEVGNGSVDLIITSPPYLNAIDYLRGHRLSLVWLGYTVAQIRDIRSISIGCERAPDYPYEKRSFQDIAQAITSGQTLTTRHSGMVARYAQDLYYIMFEIARVLRAEGRAVVIVGDSCITGKNLMNSAGVVAAGEKMFLRVKSFCSRELPKQHRYLPTPSSTAASLGKRMRRESIITFTFR